MGVIPSSIFAPGFFKRSKLQIKVLVKGRNACVAYLHLDKSLQKSPQKVSLLQDTFAKPHSLGKRPLEKLSQNLRVLQTTFRNTPCLSVSSLPRSVKAMAILLEHQRRMNLAATSIWTTTTAS